eukprot:scaffold17672_cov111-Isochrysis_galbana.AAC.3
MCQPSEADGEEALVRYTSASRHERPVIACRLARKEWSSSGRSTGNAVEVASSAPEDAAAAFWSVACAEEATRAESGTSAIARGRRDETIGQRKLALGAQPAAIGPRRRAQAWCRARNRFSLRREAAPGGAAPVRGARSHEEYINIDTRPCIGRTEDIYEVDNN